MGNNKRFYGLRLLIAVVVIFCCVSPSMGEETTPYHGSRIFWDMDSYREIFPNEKYGRMIQLHDGRLFAINGGVQGAFSSDLGNTWSVFTIQPWTDEYYLGVPDMVQLSDGTIIVAINRLPKKWSSFHYSGVVVRRSTDGGATWSDMIPVYQGSNLIVDACWEPALLELPSGELQCYFSDETEFTSTDEQEIRMCRSFDKGLTWSAPIVTSYRPGYRDGMAVPIVLKDKSAIVYTVEDMGWIGRPKFTTTTIRTTLADNWSSGTVGANNSNRSIIFATTPSSGYVSAAPYLRQLPNGETVVSYQGNEDRVTTDGDKYYDMSVVVGDAAARNFKGRTRPFVVPDNYHAQINSIAVIDTGVVVAVGMIGLGGQNSNDIYMIKGYPKTQAQATYGNVTIDGQTTAADEWTTTGGRQLTMGQVIKNKTAMDFAYDEDYLYFTANVTDDDITTSGSTHDGVYLMLDAAGVSSSTSPKAGMYKFFFGADGNVTVQNGSGGNWVSGSSTGINCVANTGTSSYCIEAAIPWSVIGKTITTLYSTKMAMDTRIVNAYSGGSASETIAEASDDASWSWLSFRLMPSEVITGIQSKIIRCQK